MLPGTSYDAVNNKLITEKDKYYMDNTFNTNDWFIINNSANILNEDGNFVEPVVSIATKKAETEIEKTALSSYKNMVYNLQTYNSQSLPISTSKFSRVEELVKNGIKQQSVIVYSTKEGIKYFVSTTNTNARTTITTSAYDNFINYVLASNDIKLSRQTEDVIAYYVYNGFIFNTMQELIDYIS